MDAFTQMQINKAFIRVEKIHKDIFDGKVREIVEGHFKKPIRDMHGSGINIEVE